jgi:hypothetical protein
MVDGSCPKNYCSPISTDVCQHRCLNRRRGWYLEILRGIVMRDVGVTALWPAILAQTA